MPGFHPAGEGWIYWVWIIVTKNCIYIPFYYTLFSGKKSTFQNSNYKLCIEFYEPFDSTTFFKPIKHYEMICLVKRLSFNKITHL